MISIRRRLLISLLSLFALSWLVVSAATYLGASHEIEEVFDAQLAQAGRIIADLPLDAFSGVEIPDRVVTRNAYGHRYERKISFQIWHRGALLLRSESAPEFPLSDTRGYSDEPIGGVLWRVFRLTDQDTDHAIYVGESYAARNELVGDITLGSLAPLLAAVPLLAILTWIGIGRSLAPLARLSREVAARSPDKLSPIDTANAPREITPVIASLNRLLDRLQRALDSERQFTNDAAHELRTPLAGIKTQTQVLRRAQAADGADGNLLKIEQSVDRASHLVDQLLTLARLEPDAVARHFTPMDLAEVVRTVVGELAPQALARGIEVEFDCDLADDANARFSGHEPGIAILLRNLIDNAIRYSPNGSQVQIGLRHAAPDWIISVTDQGPGIPEAERERVFARFHRGAGQQSFGCGLGLSIVRRIAELHRAEVNLGDGHDHRGLCVEVRLPGA